jgi:hypothetical protein
MTGVWFSPPLTYSLPLKCLWRLSVPRQPTIEFVGIAQGPMPIAKANLQGEHSLSGTISNIDRNTGQVTVKTEEAGELKLHYPPHSLAGLKEGDPITVHLGFSEGHGAAEMEMGVGTTTGTLPQDTGKKR